MKNFISTGSNVSVPAPAVVASGDGVLVGSLFVVANSNAESGQNVVLSTTGVYAIAKEATDDMTLGAPVYWKTATSTVTTTASGNAKIGVVVAPAGNPSSIVQIRLNGAF